MIENTERGEENGQNKCFKIEKQRGYKRKREAKTKKTVRDKKAEKN